MQASLFVEWRPASAPQDVPVLRPASWAAATGHAGCAAAGSGKAQSSAEGPTSRVCPLRLHTQVHDFPRFTLIPSCSWSWYVCLSELQSHTQTAVTPPHIQAFLLPPITTHTGLPGLPPPTHRLTFLVSPRTQRLTRLPGPSPASHTHRPSRPPPYIHTRTLMAAHLLWLFIHQPGLHSVA